VAVSCVEVEAQVMACNGAQLTEGFALSTANVVAADAEHPLPLLVTVTVYDPPVEVAKLLEVSPLLQE